MKKRKRGDSTVAETAADDTTVEEKEHESGRKSSRTSAKNSSKIPSVRSSDGGTATVVINKSWNSLLEPQTESFQQLFGQEEALEEHLMEEPKTQELALEKRPFFPFFGLFRSHKVPRAFICTDEKKHLEQWNKIKGENTRLYKKRHKSALKSLQRRTRHKTLKAAS